MEDKNYVGMESCFFCGKVKHILLDKRMNNTLPQNAVYNKEPCDDCKLVMEMGVLFIGVKKGESGDNPYRTGQFIGIKEEAVKKMISEPLLSSILKKRVCFVDEDTLNKMGLTYKNGNLRHKKDNMENLQDKNRMLKNLK